MKSSKKNNNSGFILRWAKKIIAIKILGGRCIKCGNSNIFQLEFHHHNSQKENCIGRIMEHRLSKIKIELSKCVLLCKNCHIITHYNKCSKNKQKLLDANFQASVCHKCGYAKNIVALDFHHKNRKNKSFTIGNMGNCGDFEKILKESKKCILLCRNCHALLHSDMNKFKKFKDAIYNKIITHKEYNTINHASIVSLRLENKTPLEISSILGYNPGTVRDSVLKKEGRRVNRLNSSSKEIIINLYRDGLNLQDISAKTNFCPETISNFLMKKRIRTKRISKIIGKENEVSKMLKNGNSISSIARKMGCSRNTIYKFIANT